MCVEKKFEVQQILIITLKKNSIAYEKKKNFYSTTIEVSSIKVKKYL